MRAVGVSTSQRVRVFFLFQSENFVQSEFQLQRARFFFKNYFKFFWDLCVQSEFQLHRVRVFFSILCAVGVSTSQSTFFFFNVMQSAFHLPREYV
jgi:hypothetical protein